MPPRFAHLAGLGALAASAGLLGLFALLVFVTRPTSLGGMTPGLSWVTWILLAVIFAALIGVHVVIGRQLLSIGGGAGEREI